MKLNFVHAVWAFSITISLAQLPCKGALFAEVTRQMFVLRVLLTLATAMAGIFVAAAPLSAQDQTRYGAGGSVAFPSPADFQGSVPAAEVTPEVLRLSLRQAIDLGLANNLGLLLSKEGVLSARGQRWVELSKLLPNLTTSATVHHLKESLAITGISLPNVPSVVGPFNFYDARVFLSQRIFDLEALRRTRAATLEVAAAEFYEKDARELVVVAVGSAYLQALADYARVETVKSQVVTAGSILDRTVEMHKAGITPGIDELRARVEWLTRSQHLIVVENQWAKQKLSLLRLIGLGVGQEIELTDQTPFQPLAAGAVQEDITRALASRDDYRAAQSLLMSARASHSAALAQHLPVLSLDADFGKTGISLSSMDSTYHIVGSLKMPIFEGGKIHGDVLRAEAQLRQREDELGDLRTRIEFEVRSALLDVSAAAREVEVVRKAVELAELALFQAEERFAAGVDDNLAVVQAQQSVATAHEGLVSSLYQHNLAKLILAWAMGFAGESASGLTGQH
jgi:outer membrane protein TolC